MPLKKVSKYGSGRPKKLYRNIFKNSYYIVIIRRLPNNIIKVNYIEEFRFKKYRDYLKFKEKYQEFNYFFITAIKGKDIIEYRLKRNKFIRGIGIHTRDKTKYDYPVERITSQDRKSMRTKMRRQKRTWGYQLDYKFI